MTIDWAERQRNSRNRVAAVVLAVALGVCTVMLALKAVIPEFPAASPPCDEEKGCYET